MAGVKIHEGTGNAFITGRQIKSKRKTKVKFTAKKNEAVADSF